MEKEKYTLVGGKNGDKIMTRQEEIIEAARSRAERHQIAEMKVYGGDKCNYSYGRIYNSEMASFEAGAEWADENPKSPWINAKNELPTKGGHYLCMDENHYITTLAFNGDRWVNTTTFFDVSLEVVKYWMPIPNLPKE